MRKANLKALTPATRVGRALSLLLLALVVTSCSSDSALSRLLKQIPADIDFVAVGNVETVVKSAGGSIEDSKVKLPSFLLSELPSGVANDLDDFNRLLKKSGVDTESCALFGNYDDKRPTLVFALADKDKFISCIEENGFRQKDESADVVYYRKKVYEGSDSDYDDYGYIAVHGDYAYWIERVWIGSSFKPQEALSDYIKDAAEKSFAETPFCDYITSGNAIGAAFKLPGELRRALRHEGVPSEIVEAYEGVICLNGSLDDAATVNGVWYNEDGKVKKFDQFRKFFNLESKVNPKALAFLGKDESFVMASSLKDVDWDELLDMTAATAGMSRSDKAAMSVVKGYLERFDGTVALGWGVTNGFESFNNISAGRNVMEQFSTTIVAELKANKGKSVIEDFMGLLESAGVPFTETSKGFRIDVRELGGSLRVEAHDQFLVMSNHAISADGTNKAVKAVDFGSYISAWAVVLDKNDQLLRDLGLKNDLEFSFVSDAEKSEVTMRLKVDDGKSEGVIASVVRMVIKLRDQQASFRKHLFSSRSSASAMGSEPYASNSSYDTDYVDADTVAVCDDYE